MQFVANRWWRRGTAAQSRPSQPCRTDERHDHRPACLVEPQPRCCHPPHRRRAGHRPGPGGPVGTPQPGTAPTPAPRCRYAWVRSWCSPRCRPCSSAAAGAAPGPNWQIAAPVGDGLSAVRQALALQPDVLFFDIRMPGQTGLDAAVALADTWPAHQPFPGAGVRHRLRPVRRASL